MILLDIERLKKEQRTLTDATAYRRSLAVLLFCTKGDLSLSGFSQDHAKRLKGQYMRIGIDAFLDKRHNGRDRILTKQEREKVIAEIKIKSPKDVIVGCQQQYWTTYLLGDYIHTLTGKKYKSKTSSYLLFKEAKLSWHKPGKVYDRADPHKQSEWKQNMKIELQQHWDDENTIVFCEDEMVLSIKSTTQKVWLPQGEYPVIIETTGTRKNVSFYGFLNMKTGAQHTFITEYQNMYITRDQLIQLREIYKDKHFVIIWDNAGWHRGSQVVKWVQEDKNTQIIYFPPYSPDMNPQEHVWKAGRKAVTHNRQILNIQETAQEFKTYLESQTFTYDLLGFRGN